MNQDEDLFCADLIESIENDDVVRLRNLFSRRLCTEIRVSYSKKFIQDPKDKISLLSLGAMLGSIKCVRFMLKRGVSFEGSKSVLQYACYGGNVKVFDEIAALPIVNVNQNLFPSYWELSVRSGSIEMVKKLWMCNYELGKTKLERENLMRLAARLDNAEIMKFLKTVGIGISAMESCIKEALLCGAAKTLEYLIELGCNPYITVQSDMTPLMFAARKHYLDVIKILVAQKSINFQDPFGWTALHYGAESGDLEICQVLLENGADVNKTTHIGMTAMHLAANRGHNAVRDLLESMGGVMWI